MRKTATKTRSAIAFAVRTIWCKGGRAYVIRTFDQQRRHRRRSARASRVSSRSDLFPRLVAMQKLADAQNFAVYRMSGSGSSSPGCSA